MDCTQSATESPVQTKSQSYRSSPTKRRRRTRDEIDALKSHLIKIIDQYKPMTVRQVYYQAVSKGLIDKTESAYKNDICRLLGVMRKQGDLPYSWLADSTRWIRKPDSYGSLGDMLDISQQCYRRAIWTTQPMRVEIWLEKEALAGVLYDVTSQWDVPLMVTRGYPSLSYLHTAAEEIAAADNPTAIYYFGDHDPSGQDISRFIEEEIGNLLCGMGWDSLCFTFHRVAVTEDQITEWDLPTRPTKKTDSRAKGFKGESVEVDAIEPDVLRQICRRCITQHIDQEAYRRLMAVESEERHTLANIMERFHGSEGHHE